jgi:hypothetical protein
MGKSSKKIKFKNNTANKRARAKYATSISPEKVGTLPPALVEGVEEAYQANQANQSPADEMFTTCPVCNDEKTRKSRATEASRKTEMILVIRDIVSRFRVATNAKFDALSADIQAQLKPIVEASNRIAITRSELSEALSDLEDDLRSGFGITDEIDSVVAGGAMFAETDEGDPFNPPEPGQDPLFDAVTSGVDKILSENDDPELIFSEAPAVGPSRPAPARKDEDQIKWN